MRWNPSLDPRGQTHQIYDEPLETIRHRNFQRKTRTLPASKQVSLPTRRGLRLRVWAPLWCVTAPARNQGFQAQAKTTALVGSELLQAKRTQETPVCRSEDLTEIPRLMTIYCRQFVYRTQQALRQNSCLQNRILRAEEDRSHDFLSCSLQPSQPTICPVVFPHGRRLLVQCTA